MLSAESATGHMHILGHPVLPLNPAAHPEDAQILNCWNFCLLMEHLHIPYSYYGTAGSILPPDGRYGTLVSCGKPTGIWKYRNSWHRLYNRRLSRLLKKETSSDGGPRWIASLYGIAQSDIEAPENLPLFEPMVGYSRCWTNFRVFPSYAQQHTIYAQQPELTGPTRYFDAVIPHFIDPREYHTTDAPGEYLLFLGRNSSGKGIEIVHSCAEATGRPLKCIHENCHGSRKAELLANAYAVMMPTLYAEPFGYVAVEAQISGTPVVCTDWGAFTETVIQGVTGFRCRTQAEFIQAIDDCRRLDRKQISSLATEQFTISAVAQKYRQYLDLLWKVCNSGGYYSEAAAMNRTSFLEQKLSGGPPCRG